MIIKNSNKVFTVRIERGSGGTVSEPVIEGDGVVTWT